MPWNSEKSKKKKERNLEWRGRAVRLAPALGLKEHYHTPRPTSSSPGSGPPRPQRPFAHSVSSTLALSRAWRFTALEVAWPRNGESQNGSFGGRRGPRRSTPPPKNGGGLSLLLSSIVIAKQRAAAVLASTRFLSRFSLSNSKMRP